MPIDQPPASPLIAQVQQAEDRKKYAEEQHRLRKKEEEERRKAVDAQNLIRAKQTQQKR